MFSKGEIMDTDKEDPNLPPEEICQKFFTRLGDFLTYHKIKLMKIISKYVYDDVFYSREVQLIYIDDFFRSLREYGFSYSQRETTDVSQCIRVKGMKGVFILEMIEKILTGLGIPRGLPPSTKAMNFDTLDMKSFRLINRLLIYSKKLTISDITEKLKDKIEEIEIVDGSNKANNVAFISADNLNEFLRENKLTRDFELHENLQFFLCISKDKAFEKIMIKKLVKLLEMCKDNEYVLSIGPNKRQDPKGDIEDEKATVIEPKIKKKKLSDDEDNEAFDEFDLSDEDEATKKKFEREMKMLERRKTRKSTKKIIA